MMKHHADSINRSKHPLPEQGKRREKIQNVNNDED